MEGGEEEADVEDGEKDVEEGGNRKAHLELRRVCDHHNERPPDLGLDVGPGLREERDHVVHVPVHERMGGGGGGGGVTNPTAACLPACLSPSVPPAPCPRLPSFLENSQGSEKQQERKQVLCCLSGRKGWRGR